MSTHKTKMAALFLLMSFSLGGCQSKVNAEIAGLDVDPSYFLKEGLVTEIVQEERELSDGRKALCYVITTKSVPHDHEMGPWCPRSISDGKDKGGIWFKDGEVYNVDGPFIAGLATFYGDDRWKMFREDGTVKVTDTKEAFELAARPDVDPRYENYCVECPPELIEGKETTYIIPVTPRANTKSTDAGRIGGGLALNGVKFEAPAPYHAIVAAHTIAPLDPAGGHVNPHVGYHYHAATGRTTEIAQDDGHSPMIGYAMDGFGIFAALDEKGTKAEDLDECGGHEDKLRGYHYHAGTPGENRIVKKFRGTPGVMIMSKYAEESPSR